MASGEDNMTALKNAVRKGDKDLVVKLLDRGFDPNQYDMRSLSGDARSPAFSTAKLAHLLHEVCKTTDNANMVKILLNKDPDIINYTWP